MRDGDTMRFGIRLLLVLAIFGGTPSAWACAYPDGTSVLDEWTGSASGSIGYGDPVEHSVRLPADCPNSALRIRIEWASGGGDLDLYVTAPSGTQSNSIAASNSPPEEVVYDAPAAAGNYLVSVQRWGGLFDDALAFAGKAYITVPAGTGCASGCEGTTTGETAGGGSTGGETTGGSGVTTAVLSATPTAGNAPLQVDLDASASISGDGSALSYSYYFGDGSEPVVTDADSLSYTYTAAGTFEAVVLVSDASGNTASSSAIPIAVTTTIVVDAPIDCSDRAVAALVVTPTQGIAPLTVEFDGSRSFGVCGTAIARYAWDFGDGSATQTTAAPIVSHVYTRAGTYTPSLSVTDVGGNVSPAKAMAQVKASTPDTGTGPGSGSAVPASGNGGGALGAGLLVPLAVLAALRRRRR